jgi:hypothetical protein
MHDGNEPEICKSMPDFAMLQKPNRKSNGVKACRHNHATALKMLDWRRRFKVIADPFGLSPPRWAHELDLRVAARI